MDQELIFISVKEDFHKLWKMRSRGETLEVITPYVTANDDFISVFISSKGSGYIVSDGGWVADKEYDFEPEEDIICELREICGIQALHMKNGRTLHLKKVEEREMLSAAVLSLCLFIIRASSLCKAVPAPVGFTDEHLSLRLRK